MRNNKDKIKWHYLSYNPCAVSFLLENEDKINWKLFSANTSIDAINYLKNNKDKIDKELFSSNSAIFTYDYEKIRKNREELNEDIINAVIHPKRLFRLISEYGEDEIYNIYFDE